MTANELRELINARLFMMTADTLRQLMCSVLCVPVCRLSCCRAVSSSDNEDGHLRGQGQGHGQAQRKPTLGDKFKSALHLQPSTRAHSDSVASNSNSNSGGSAAADDLADREQREQRERDDWRRTGGVAAHNYERQRLRDLTGAAEYLRLKKEVEERVAREHAMREEMQSKAEQDMKQRKELDEKMDIIAQNVQGRQWKQVRLSATAQHAPLLSAVVTQSFQEFLLSAQELGRIIIEELVKPYQAKSIKPTKQDGIRFITNNIVFECLEPDSIKCAHTLQSPQV